LAEAGIPAAWDRLKGHTPNPAPTVSLDLLLQALFRLGVKRGELAAML
jgi:hypothetical protein